MSSSAQPIKTQPSRHGSIARSPFSGSYLSSSYLSGSPIAQESIARDLAEYGDDEVETPESGETSSEDDSSEASTVRPDAQQHSMANSYRRPSFVAFGGTRPALTPQLAESATKYLTKKEKKQSRDEERS